LGGGWEGNTEIIVTNEEKRKVFESSKGPSFEVVPMDILLRLKVKTEIQQRKGSGEINGESERKRDGTLMGVLFLVAQESKPLPQLSERRQKKKQSSQEGGGRRI